MKLVRATDPVLRSRANREPPVAGVELAAEMFTRVKAWGGVGLAAPQVGIGSRIAVVELDEQRFVLISPTLHVPFRARWRREPDIEGCLSLPGRYFTVRRFSEISVTTQLPDGPVTIAARGWLARVIQHELDHLNGLLIDQRGTELGERERGMA